MCRQQRIRFKYCSFRFVRCIHFAFIELWRSSCDNMNSTTFACSGRTWSNCGSCALQQFCFATQALLHFTHQDDFDHVRFFWPNVVSFFCPFHVQKWNSTTFACSGRTWSNCGSCALQQFCFATRALLHFTHQDDFDHVCFLGRTWSRFLPFHVPT